MQLIIDSLLVLVLLVAALWLISLRSSINKDRLARLEQARQAAEDQARATQAARLYRTRKTLRCLSCDQTFSGPLSETGCPQCHLASLVVIEAEYQKSQQCGIKKEV